MLRNSVVMMIVALMTALLVPRFVHGKAKLGRYLVDAKGETVLDTTTTLTWQRGGLGAVDQAKLWEDAATYCAGLVLAGAGWRLPTVVELHSLVDRGAKGPVIDKAAFPATATSWYWTATKYKASQPPSAWYVDFETGGVGVHGLVYTNRVRCVR